jgi:hypothetical protein
MDALIPPRYPSWEAAERLKSVFGIPHEHDMQDWPLEVSDSTRLQEFCDAYEFEKLNDIEKFALMQLILFSVEDEPKDPSQERIKRLLLCDFLLHLHTLNYWRLPEETGPENVFPITSLIREVWEEGYRAEYGIWLDKPL